MKSVLYISYDGMTDPLGQSQVIPYLVGLARKGHRITVLSCEKAANFAEFESRCAGLFETAGIQWHHVPYTKRPPVISTYLDLARMRRMGARLARTTSFDIIHCRTVISMLVGAPLRGKTDAKLVFDTRSFWTDERVEGGLWNLGNPLFRGLYTWFKGKENQFYRESDLLFALTKKAKTHIESLRPGPGGAPIHVVPCSVDMEHFAPERIDPARVDHHRAALGLIGDSFVLAYLGSLGTRYMLREMLEFFKVLHSQEPAARFVFITRNEHDAIRSTAADLGLPEGSVLIAPTSYDDVPNIVALADASVFFIKVGDSGSAVSPVKQAELLSMGKRVVCNAGIGDCDEIIGTTGAGIVLRRLDQVAYTDAASQLLSSSGQAPDEIRHVARTRLSLANAVEAYDAAWESLG